MSVKMKFGSKDIPFVYKGDKLVYPNPIKDGLLLWYDFKGIRNTDTNKEVAKDLSGNGNDGTLTNFNFTEESGYKDNTLIFDGIDDRLTIPELELDETAMTVVQDGEIYSYEDDKVLTVGEDGEIVGSGKNIISGSNFQDGVGLWSTIYGTQKIEGGIYKKTFTTLVGAARLEITFYGLDKGIYTLTLKSKFPTPVFLSGFVNATLLSDSTLQPSTSDFKMDSIVFEVEETGLNTTIRMYVREQGFNNTYEIDWYSLVKGETLLGRYTPHPSDYKTTALTPASLTDLQLYDKTLRKDELLHNAESKGLKKLKPGVVVQDGLVLHYDFSHESNTSEYKNKAFDYSGNGNHGVLQNFGYAEGSGYDEGITFDGVDDGIQSIGLWEDTGKVTIEAVVKKFPNGNNGAIIGATNRNFELLLFRDATVVAYYSDGTNTNYRQHQFTLYELTEKINYLAVVFHKDLDKVELYANGALKAQRTDPENRDLTGFEPSDTIRLGHRNSTNRLQGEIYSTRIYKKALTPEEIAHNYQIEKENYNIVEGDS